MNTSDNRECLMLLVKSESFKILPDSATANRSPRFLRTTHEPNASLPHRTTAGCNAPLTNHDCTRHREFVPGGWFQLLKTFDTFPMLPTSARVQIMLTSSICLIPLISTWAVPGTGHFDEIANTCWTTAVGSSVTLGMNSLGFLIICFLW